MRLLAVREAAQLEDEELTDSEGRGDQSERLTEIGRQMKELDARQARIENHSIKLVPSAKKAEEQFATIVLAGKELRDEMAEHRKNISTSLTQYREQVTATAGEIEGEFQHQLQLLQAFFDQMLKLSEKNERLAGRCQEMMATISAIYHKGSAGVSEMSEKTQAHLKATSEAHCKEIEAQAQHFESVYGRLIKMLVVGTVIILLTALIAGIMTGSTWITIRQQQAEKEGRQNSGAIVIRR